MKKELYISPKMEIIDFATKDVIETSGGGGAEPDISEDSEQPVLPWD